ncbi:lachesin-like isoform X2 [Tachypleus tridentatus]|uniref:lachesin-like isoform X2 n=1 Tax=Tachypleus tridentatus TaxID=6853 RepID=UPI003FD55AC2
MYEWAVITFLATLNISSSWTLPTTNPVQPLHVSPDLVEVDCREKETIGSETLLKPINGTPPPNGKLSTYLENHPPRRPCCSLCFPNVRSNSDECFSEGKNETRILQIQLYISVPANVRSMRARYRMAVCQGGNVHMLCNISSSRSRISISWRRTWDNNLFHGQSLIIPNVQREDEVPPLIFVPNEEVNITVEFGCVLECIVEGLPAPDVYWFKDNTVLDERTFPDYNISIKKAANCTVFATLNISPRFLTVISNDSSYGNYTCEASNKHGRSRAFLQLIDIYETATNKTVANSEEEKSPKKFNVTGFIVGMLPPLFISFYIILKLGYRSRYAEERAEEQGMREEPFFVSY